MAQIWCFESDGSVRLYFCPTKPDGVAERNWIQTDAGQPVTEVDDRDRRHVRRRGAASMASMLRAPME